MAYRSKQLAVVLLLVTGAACGSGRTSPAAFRLPPDGNVERGKTAFLAFGCNSCHEVSGVDLPRPSVQPPVPVILGGLVDTRLSNAYLVTSIIYPSYELAPFARRQVARGGHSRMPEYAETMTVRQLTDIVGFLQAHYFVPRLPVIR
jgi:sulfur-oxidizing protein SoxX